MKLASTIEHKKRECWRIYVGAFDIKDEIPNEAFNWVFDRAYALGREKETVSQEEIRKAAVEYAEENMWYPGETSYEDDINDMTESFADAFESGANFALGKQEKYAEKKRSALTDKEVYALESAISELESLIEGTLDEDYHKEQKSIINALKRIIKKYDNK